MLRIVSDETNFRPSKIGVERMNSTILFFAMRYAMPRKTAAAGIVAREIRRVWSDLSDTDKAQLVDEVRQGLKFNKVGDKITWERVLRDITKNE